MQFQNIYNHIWKFHTKFITKYPLWNIKKQIGYYKFKRISKIIRIKPYHKINKNAWRLVTDLSTHPANWSQKLLQKTAQGLLAIFIYKYDYNIILNIIHIY